MTRIRLAIGCLSTALLGSALAAQAPRFTFTGAGSGDEYGFAVAMAGDVDGDGLGDVLIGARFGDGVLADVGTAEVRSGADGSLIWKFEGDAPGDEFGSALAGAGDVDGDGLADLIVGAPQADPAGVASGRARVFSGADGSVLYTFDGAAAGATLGNAVSGAGDVNEDGHADVVVAARAEAGGAGRATVYSGRDGSVLWSWVGAAGDFLGTSVGGVGDIDGDCAADVIVGSPAASYGGAAAGRVQIFSGADGTVLRVHDGATAGDRLGLSVGGAGDVDGDGVPDYIVGAPEADYAGANAGRAVVRSGVDGSVLHTLDGARPGDGFGAWVSGVGDVNADDRADFAVASPPADYADENAGRVQLFSGADGTVLHTVDGAASGDRLSRVAGGGDVNADGYADFVAGASRADANGVDAGVVQVFALAPLDAFVETVFPGIGVDQLGRRVAGSGDVNNDGRIDYVVGAPVGDYVRVLTGEDASVVRTFTGIPLEEFGHGVDILRDINGDGFDEVIVGGTHNDQANRYAGRVVVFSGQDGSQIYQWLGSARFAHAGYGVADAGDVDNDGTADILYGAWGENVTATYAGQAVVCSGATGAVLYRFDGDAPYDFLGWSVAPAGDVNGDGFADVIAGAPDDWTVIGEQGPGYVRVYSGFDGSILWQFTGDDLLDDFGFEVAGGADVDGDGVPDIVAGIPWDDDNGVDSGSVRVFSGADGTVLWDLDGYAAGDDFGRGVALVDLDVDGFADIFVAAPLADVDGVPDVGRAYVFCGETGVLLETFDGATPASEFGWSLTSIGDVDGDNHPDLVVGAGKELIGGIAKGSAHRYLSTVRTDPGRTQTFGPPCAGTNGYLPRISVSRRPVVGRRFDIELSTALPNTTALANLDTTSRNTPLGPLAPGCVMLASPAVQVSRLTDGDGKASIHGLARPAGGPLPLGEVRRPGDRPLVDVPPVASLVGREIHVQWWVLDPGANALGLATSDAVRVTLGR